MHQERGMGLTPPEQDLKVDLALEKLQREASVAECLLHTFLMFWVERRKGFLRIGIASFLSIRWNAVGTSAVCFK